jgi:hypothetical protein
MRGRMAGMVIRVLVVVAWTVAFFFGSAMLLGFASGLYFVGSLSAGGKVDDRTTAFVGMLWAYVPMIMGPVGLALGIFGKLPGTRSRKSTKQGAIVDPPK